MGFIVQKHRFTTILKIGIIGVLTSSLMIGTPASAGESDPKGSTIGSEEIGCLTEGYRTIDTWALRYKGKKRPGIGHVLVRTRPSPSDNSNVRVCAVTKHGKKTDGKRRYTAVEVGSMPAGGGTRDLYFWDRGPARERSDGRAITPGGNRCFVGVGKIKHKGNTYRVMIDLTNVADDSKICN